MSSGFLPAAAAVGPVPDLHWPNVLLFPDEVIRKLGSLLLVDICSLVQFQKLLTKLRLFPEILFHSLIPWETFILSSFGKASEIVFVLKHLAGLAGFELINGYCPVP